mmetsp:Transcript_5014/g.9097  ORF Transcript_5014/g.9097 Transcript_5014/m.9097 type:complete len:318 (-) Transcript_5014:127-1080(-)
MMSDEQKYTPVALATTPGPTDEQTIATPVAVGINDSNRFLEVASPANLPENHAFEVDVEGQCLMVKVPAGGAREGQKISVPFPSGWTAVCRVSTPVGHWKDGMCECFRHGVFHPLLFNACYCPLVATGQIMHRLKLTWLGNEGTIAQTTATFRTILWIAISYYIGRFVIGLLMGANSVYQVVEVAKMMASSPNSGNRFGGNQPAHPKNTVGGLLVWGRILFILSFVVFVIYLIAKTRKHIRSKYGIPEQSCHGCEDFCCALWCQCCTVAQMGRHTADYDTYAALCCSENGQPPHVPSVEIVGHPRHFHPSNGTGGIV